MEARWIRQAGAAEAIVVFGGWAVGPDAFAHLAGPQDLLFVADYRNLDAELPELTSYKRVSLMAWSFGVASYGHWQRGRPDPFARKVAVSGSLTPVNRLTGIPPVAMARTVQALDHASYQQFLSRVFNATQPDTALDVCDRRAELNAVALRGDAAEPGFDRVLIAKGDRIFPPQNLRRAWAGGPLREIDGPHAPFAQFETWEDLLA